MDNKPGYTIQTEFREGYLWALVGGEALTAAIAEKYWNEIASKCEANSCEKILIEKDFKIPVGPQDLIKMAEHVARILPMIRIAFVDRRHHDSINELGKRLARNQDIKMQTFSNLRDAEKWLRAN
ncbi:MAG TPA: hypothetical protein VEV84_04555 [Pyrinomonadaceae bacterium]|jgi:hypothetical protein|nr:hypothetical protein [Pyrinomonadaceae bacterium]